jgi:hypothetical protein
VHPRDVVDDKDLVKFIKRLVDESSNPSCGWENCTLPDFLEAMAAWTEAGVEDWYKLHDIDLSKVTKWRMFADILKAATMYE